MQGQPFKTHLPSVAQLIISVAGIVTSVGTVLLFLLLMLAGKSIPEYPLEMDQQIPTAVWTWLIISLVAIPSLVLSIRRLARLSKPERKPRFLLLVLSILVFFLVAGVFFIYRDSAVLNNSFLYVFLTVIAVVIPLLWFVELGQFKLFNGSSQRRWGLANFAIFVGLPLVIVVEIIIFVLVAVIGFSQIEYKPLLMTFQTQLMLNPTDFSGMLDQLGSLAQNPKVWVTGFFLVALLIPLFEEILKPLAMWFFIKREWSPSEGFSAGLILGASFALVESITSLSTVSQDVWVVTLIGRCGTGLLHTLTTGLTGWALAASWRDGKYTRVCLTYLVSVLLHGSWNFFALLFGLGTNMEDLLTNAAVSGLVNISPWIMGILFILMLTILFFMNRKIRNSLKPPVLPVAPPSIPPLPFETMR